MRLLPAFLFHVRSSHRRCSVKKGVLKYFAIFTGKHLRWNLFLIKQLFEKETPTKFLSCEYCEICKNTYFEERLQKDASDMCYVKLKTQKFKPINPLLVNS